jgi:signal transduction histidine kinase
MIFPPIIERLFPRESDSQFRASLGRFASSGIQTLAVVEMAVPLLMALTRLAVGPAPGNASLIYTVIPGAATVALSRLPWSRRHPRLLSAISMWILCSLFVLGANAYMPAGVAVTLLTGVLVVPFRPSEMLATGASIDATYLIWSGFAGVPGMLHGSAEPFLAAAVLLATAVALMNYNRLRAEFARQRQAIRTAEALTGAQLRAQLAENAIALGKLAATLTHEISTPLGTMRSSIDTLVAVTSRQVDAPPARREILAKMREELCRSIAESAARIEEVMGRLRRFVNLEEAELKSADINELVADVMLLYQEQVERRKIRLQFDREQSLPALICRPQLLSAVFASLLSNAINAVNGDGAIGISTRRCDSLVEVTVRDNGRGMSAEEADSIFDPAFRITEGRVSSGNWSLYNARQIVYQHGGEIRLDTAPGRGTAVHVSLPLGNSGPR